jgi:alanine dehydrogenase
MGEDVRGGIVLVGIPREVKNRESRVALTPDGAAALVSRGHEVVVESTAGDGAGFADDDYADAGARVGSADDAWGAEFVLKVKEPVPDEYARLRADLTLFTFLHLAANETLATALVDSRCTAISYDTVHAADGSLPILRPMSEVAGRLSVIAGAYHLLGPQGGRGLLLSGLGGADGVRVVVIGAGVAGSNAALQAAAMGADVTALDLDASRLAALGAVAPAPIRTAVSSPSVIARATAEADLVIGAVLVPGRPAPKVVTHAMVEAAPPGSVFVDIAIDQGGCFEDSHPTTHDAPTFRVAGSVFYCVANMPGAAGRTSTQALTSVTLPYALQIADFGWERACDSDPQLGAGLSSAFGKLRHPAAMEAFPTLPAHGGAAT